MVLNLGTAEFSAKITGIDKELKRLAKDFERSKYSKLEFTPVITTGAFRQFARELEREIAKKNGVVGKAAKAGGESIGETMADEAASAFQVRAKKQLPDAIADSVKDALRTSRRTRGRAFTDSAGEDADEYIKALRRQLEAEVGDTIADSLRGSTRESNREAERVGEQNADEYLDALEAKFRAELSETISGAIARSRQATERSSERLAEQNADAFVEQTEQQLRRELDDAFSQAIASARDAVEDASERLGQQAADELSQRLERDLRSQVPQAVSDAVLSARIESQQAAGRVGDAAANEYANEFEDRLRRDLDGAIASGIRSARGDGNRAAADAGRRAGDAYSDAFESASRSRAGSVGGSFGGGFSSGLLGTAATTGANFVAGLGVNIISGVVGFGIEAGARFGAGLVEGVVNAIATMNELIASFSREAFSQIKQSVELGSQVDTSLIQARILAGSVSQGQDFNQVKGAIDTVAADKRYTVGPVDLATAANLLARAGQDYEAIAGILPSVGAGITVTGENAERFTENYLDFAAKLNIEAEKQQEVLGLLIGASTAAKVDIPELASGGRYFRSNVGGIEGAQQVAQLLAIAARGGFTGSSAGVGLNNALSRDRINRATQGTSTIGASLPGLALTEADYQDQVGLLRKIVGEYRKELENARLLGDDAVNEFEINFAKAFGERGSRLLGAIIELESDDLDQVVQSVNNGQSTLDELFKAYENRVGIGFNAIENSIESGRLETSKLFATLFDSAGVGLSGFIDQVFQGSFMLGDVVRQFDEELGRSVLSIGGRGGNYTPATATGLPGLVNGRIRGEDPEMANGIYQQIGPYGVSGLVFAIAELENALAQSGVVEALTTIKDSVVTSINIIIDRFSFAALDIADFFSQGDNAEEFATTIKGVLAVINQLTTGVIDFYANAGVKFYQIVKDVVDLSDDDGVINVGEFFVNLTDRLADEIPAFAKRLRRLASDVLIPIAAPIVAEFTKGVIGLFFASLAPRGTAFGDGIREIGADLAAGFRPLIDPLRDLFVNNGPGLITFFKTIWDIAIGLLETASTIAATVVRLADTLLQALLPPVNGFLQGTYAIVLSLKSVIDPLFATVNGALGESNRMLADALLGWNKLNFAVNEALNNFGEALSRTTANLADFFNWGEAFSGIGQAFDEAAIDLARKFNALMGGIARWFGWDGGNAVSQDEGILVASGDLYGLIDSTNLKTESSFERTWNNISGAVTGALSGLWADWRKFSDDVLSDADRIDAYLQQKVDELWAWVKRKVREAGEYIQGEIDKFLGMLDNLKEGAIAIFDDLASQFTEFGKRGRDALSGWGDALRIGIQNAFPVLERLATFIDQIGGSTAKFASSVADTFSNLKESAGNAVGGLAGRIGNAASAILPVTARVVDTQVKNSPWASATMNNPLRVPVAAQFIPMSSSNSLAKDLVNNPTIRRFLDLLSYAEGAGYSTQYTGKQFSGFGDHPRQILGGNGLYSDAAGRYQFLSTTYDALASRLGLRDFSPASQDIAAVQLLIDNNAIAPILSGQLSTAIDRVADVWASLPTLATGTSFYGQGGKSFSDLISRFQTGDFSGGGSQGMISLPTLPTGTLSAQEFGAHRHGGRNHAGQDFDLGPNDSFPSLIGGRVVKKGFDAGGYGNYIDVFNDQLGLVERIAELDTLNVGIGDYVRPGQTVGRGTKTTGVVHVEYRKSDNGSAGYGFSGALDPVAILESLGIYRRQGTSLVPTGAIAGLGAPSLSLPEISGISELRDIAQRGYQGFKFNLPSLTNALSGLGSGDAGFTPISSNITQAIANAIRQFASNAEQVNFVTSGGEAVSFEANPDATAIKEFFANRGLGEGNTGKGLSLDSLLENTASSLSAAALAAAQRSGAIAPGAVLLGSEHLSYTPYGNLAGAANALQMAQGTYLGDYSNGINSFDFVDALANQATSSYTASGVMRDVKGSRRNHLSMRIDGISQTDTITGADVLRIVDTAINHPGLREAIIDDVMTNLEHNIVHRDRVGLSGY